MQSIIRDISLAPQGHDKINWVKQFMPVLNNLNDELEPDKTAARTKSCRHHAS